MKIKTAQSLCLVSSVSAFLLCSSNSAAHANGNGLNNNLARAGQRLQRMNIERTTYMNDLGVSRNLQRGVSLDLSSAADNITIGANLLGSSTVTLNVGDQVRDIQAGSKVTAAEFAALNQMLATGQQGLVLDGRGTAVGGSLNLNQVSNDGKIIRTSEFVVPEHVSVIGDFARTADGVRVMNDLVNYGSIYAVSSNPAKNLAVIGARDINNQNGGLIDAQLDLALRADRDINNAGSIVSAGELELSAGRAVHNSSHIEGMKNVSINTPQLINSGVISSSAKDVSVLAPVDSNLSIENTGGEIKALLGNINVGTTALNNPKLDTNLIGGNWYADNLNINSADGHVLGNVDDISAQVNIKAGAAHFNANSESLRLGVIQLTGDPAFSNAGNLDLSALAMTTAGAPLALVAGGDILAGTATTIDTSNGAGAGGDILIVAGAVFNIGGGNLNITGHVSGGGNVDLSGITTLTTKGTTNGGDIQIYALNSSGFGKGGITLPAALTITTGGAGAGTNGDVTLMAESNSVGITTGKINTTGGSGGGGSITIRNNQVSFTTVVVDNTTGAITSGGFTAGTFDRDAPITVGDLTTFNAPILIDTGANTITTNGLTATNSSVDVSNRTFGNILNVNASTITANHINLDSAGPLNILSISALTAQTDLAGNGGFIQLDGQINHAPGELKLSAIGTANGGTIIYNDSSKGVSYTLGGTGSNLLLDAHGNNNGGTVTYTAASGTIVINAGGIDYSGKNGDGGKFTIQSKGTTLNDFSFLAASKATGANGNGGNLFLTGTTFFTSTALNPLILNADGNGTGNGGSVIYGNLNNILPTFVGTPTKAPKGPANFLIMSAKSGALGGNGGKLVLQSGGDLTVMDAANNFNALPQSGTGNWTGATYILNTGKDSGFVFNGSLSASGVGSGDGGEVEIGVNAKSVFSFNTGVKAPKFGISGTVTAKGNNGLIQFFNNQSGAKILTSAALDGNNMTLFVEEKGSLTSNKGVVINASQSMRLNSEFGDIKDLVVSTPSLEADSDQAGVSITNTLNTLSTLVDSSAGKSFKLTTSGPTNLESIATLTGSITITGGNGGMLQVLAGENIKAANGALIIANPDTTNGEILIGTNARVETSGAKGKTTTIVIGPVVKKGTSPVPPGMAPLNIAVTATGKGVVFFGTAGTVVGQGSNTAQALEKNVIFNNASTGGKLITLANGADVIADPPPRSGSVTSASLFSHDVNSASDMAPAALQLSSATSVQSDAQNLGDMTAVLLNDTTNNANVLTGSATSGGKTSFQMLRNRFADDIQEADGSQYIVGGAFYTDNESVPDDLGIGSHGAAQVAQRESGRLSIDGNVVLAPEKDTMIETAHGNVNIAAGSVVVLITSENGLAVYDLHDVKRNAVTVHTNGKQIALSPGRHLHIAKQDCERFDEINAIELAHYRPLNTLELNDEKKVFTSEFSIPSVCFAVKPLRQLMTSKHQHARKIAADIMKTTAVILAIKPNTSDFAQHFKSRRMAMR